jgi:hypothetical protein
MIRRLSEPVPLQGFNPCGRLFFPSELFARNGKPRPSWAFASLGVLTSCRRVFLGTRPLLGFSPLAHAVMALQSLPRKKLGSTLSSQTTPFEVCHLLSDPGSLRIQLLWVTPRRPYGVTTFLPSPLRSVSFAAVAPLDYCFGDGTKSDQAHRPPQRRSMAGASSAALPLRRFQHSAKAFSAPVARSSVSSLEVR